MWSVTYQESKHFVLGTVSIYYEECLFSFTKILFMILSKPFLQSWLVKRHSNGHPQAKTTFSFYSNTRYNAWQRNTAWKCSTRFIFVQSVLNMSVDCRRLAFEYTDQSVFEREAPTFRKDNCSRPPTAQYLEARGMIEVSFESLWEYKWRHQRVFLILFPSSSYSSSKSQI